MNYAGDISPTAAWELLTTNPRARIVDVRTVGEWQQIGVPDTTATGNDVVFIEWMRGADGSVNDRFVEQLADAGITGGDDAPVVFLCRSGQRSIAAAVAATAAGIAPSYNIEEGFEGAPDAAGNRGWQGWQGAGLPQTTYAAD